MTTRLSHVTNGRLVLDVVDTGPLDGPPVVLLHGFPQRASSWGAVTAVLHDAGLRTLALDQRGYSPGARPRTRLGYRLPALVSDVVALVDAIGPGPVHLAGHDWGSAVAWATAAAHPSRISSLTAVSVPHPAAFLRAIATGSQALRSWYISAFQLTFVPEWALGEADRPGVRALRASGMTSAMIDDFVREVVRTGALTGGLGYYRAMPLTGPRGAVRRVRVPTTHVWSDGDTALGRRGADLCARYVDAPYALEVYEGVSHWIPDEAPERLAATILARIGA